MKVLLVAINAKYIHSNLGVYSLKAYGDKRLRGRNCSLRISIEEDRIWWDFPAIYGIFRM